MCGANQLSRGDHFSGRVAVDCHVKVAPTPIQNVISKRAKARVAIDERLLRNRSFARSVGQTVVTLTDGLVGNRPAERDCVGLSVALIGTPLIQLA
jgi:hypothetical protein